LALLLQRKPAICVSEPGLLIPETNAGLVMGKGNLLKEKPSLAAGAEVRDRIHITCKAHTMEAVKSSIADLAVVRGE